MDINAESHLRSVDPVLGRLIDKFGPVQVKATREPPFHSLVHAIAHQQLTGKAANTILKRFRALCGNRRFPTPARVLEMAPEKICSAGFSKAKAKYIQGIAECAANKSLLALDQSECKRCLLCANLRLLSCLERRICFAMPNCRRTPVSWWR